jgi:hypothetical protein
MKEYKSAPTKMISLSGLDKKGNLIIQSIKEYPNSKDNRTDKVLVSKKELIQAKKLKQGDMAGFKKMFYPYCYKLNVTSAAVRTNLANHARALSHCLRHIAKAIERTDLCKMSGDYGKKGKDKLKAVKAKTSKLIKAKVKQAKRKKARKAKVKQ